MSASHGVVHRNPMLGVLTVGTSDSPVTTPQFYSASYTEDTRRVTNHLVEQFPSSPLVAVGWSLGANILMKCVTHGHDHWLSMLQLCGRTWYMDTRLMTGMIAYSQISWGGGCQGTVSGSSLLM
jgi:hypothetical protein